MADATVEGPGSEIPIRKIGKRREGPVGVVPTGSLVPTAVWVTGDLGFSNSLHCRVRLGTDPVNNCQGIVSSRFLL